MVISNIIGICALVFAVTMDIPQIIKILKKRTVKGISILMLLLKMLMIIMWLIYGLLISDPFLTTTNIICVINAIITIFLWFKYRSSRIKIKLRKV